MPSCVKSRRLIFCSYFVSKKMARGSYWTHIRGQDVNKVGDDSGPAADDGTVGFEGDVCAVNMEISILPRCHKSKVHRMSAKYFSRIVVFAYSSTHDGGLEHDTTDLNADRGEPCCIFDFLVDDLFIFMFIIFVPNFWLCR